MEEKRLGLIVNPVAGIGGRVGLKGSDGAEIQKKALEMGAEPRAGERARIALSRLQPLDGLEIITYPGEMGEQAARDGGFEPCVIGDIRPGHTTSQDTREAAREMARREVQLLLFAGGDGTARDVYSAVGDRLPVLGVPAGVKIHSAVFGTSPGNAGDLASLYLRGQVTNLQEAEVMDIDEAAFREGSVSARLYGYLKIPYRTSLVQSMKVASRPGEGAALRGIAQEVIEGMEKHDGYLYIMGPGTTTRAIARELGIEKTLLGVDVVFQKQLLASDVNEEALLELVEGRQAKIIVTPIGGQGYIFGRGNQQISSRVIEKVGAESLIVVSTNAKIHSLRGQPLLVDTGDRAVDKKLTGYVRVITDYNEQYIYKVTC